MNKVMISNVKWKWITICLFIIQLCIREGKSYGECI
nr:MAG TPA: hypothetical protein [Caudoviricetes sp.]